MIVIRTSMGEANKKLKDPLRELHVRLSACYGARYAIELVDQSILITVDKTWNEQDATLFQSLYEQHLITNPIRVYPPEKNAALITVSLQVSPSQLAQALRWLARKMDACGYPDREIGGAVAYRLMQDIHVQYIGQKGPQETQQPELPFLR